jgi:hypothetical protein
MKIDAIVQQGNVSAAQQEKTPSLPQKGDVLRADVISQQDDGVTLRTQDGRVIKARLESDVTLLPNDIAELLVTESTPDKLVLRLVYAQPAVQEITNMPQRPPATVNGNFPPEVAQLMQAFDALDSKPSMQTINQAAQAMQEYGIDAKTAAFLCANSIEISPGIIRTLQNMISGNSLGKTLLALANSIQPSAETEDMHAANLSNTASSADTESHASSIGNDKVQQSPASRQEISAFVDSDRQPVELITQAVNDPIDTKTGLFVQNKPLDKESAGMQPFNNADIPAGQPEVSGSQKVQTTTSSSSKLAETNLTAVPQGTQQIPETAQEANTIVRYEVVDTQAQNTADMNASENTALVSKDITKPLNTRELSDRVLSLFAKADEGLNGETLKNAAKDAINKLPQLQEWIKHTDINDKQSALTRIDDVQAQAKLTQDISRFVCMQIPVAMKGCETAELYVYRRNRKDGKIDPENTAIALGISTQTLGRVEALLRVESRTISIAFGVENEAAVPAFREETVGLKKALSGLHYSLAECKVAKLTAKVTPVNAEETLSAAAKKKRGVTIEYMV